MADGDYFWKCAQCGCRQSMPQSMNDWYREDSRRDFFCFKGHRNHYSDSDNDIDKMRRERDQLRQRTAYLEDMRREADERADKEGRRAAAFKGQTTRLRNRAKAGICPCCNRHFENLQRHMAGQHPDFEAEPQEPA